jgi:hypothetical protein
LDALVNVRIVLKVVKKLIIIRKKVELKI